MLYGYPSVVSQKGIVLTTGGTLKASRGPSRTAEDSVTFKGESGRDSGFWIIKGGVRYAPRPQWGSFLRQKNRPLVFIVFQSPCLPLVFQRERAATWGCPYGGY